MAGMGVLSCPGESWGGYHSNSRGLTDCPRPSLAAACKGAFVVSCRVAKLFVGDVSGVVAAGEGRGHR
jgi:hypothetical protein